MSDYLTKETPDSATARLREKADESKEEKERKKKGEEIGTSDPKSSKETESEKLGADPSTQRVITFRELLEDKKISKPFKSNTETGEQQQEV